MESVSVLVVVLTDEIGYIFREDGISTIESDMEVSELEDVGLPLTEVERNQTNLGVILSSGYKKFQVFEPGILGVTERNWYKF